MCLKILAVFRKYCNAQEKMNIECFDWRGCKNQRVWPNKLEALSGQLI